MGIGYQKARNQLDDPPGRRLGSRARGAPLCLPGRHPRRRGVRGLSRNAPARAPAGTLSMWARAPCAPCSLCGRSPRERRGTGTTPFPSSQLQSPTPETRRIGGSSPGGTASAQSDRAHGRGDRRRPDLRSRGLWYGWDQNSLGVGPPLDAVSLMTYSNASQPRSKCSRSWQEHARA